MLTQCPGCQTVFRVTSTILRAAHGQVRCGRCNTQFDAIEQLLDGDEQDGTVTQTALKSLDSTVDHTDSEDNDTYTGTAVAHEDIVMEGNRIEISGIYPGAFNNTDDVESALTRTTIEESNLDRDEWEAALASITTEQADDDEDMADAELEDVEEVISETSLVSALASLDKHRTTDEQSATSDVAEVATESVQPASADQTSSLSALNPWLTARSGDMDEPLWVTHEPRRWPWTTASVVLGFVLLAQVLHHYRQDLARHPGFGPQLTRLYATLGQPLEPQWDLDFYSIKQWGIVSDPQAAGTLRVRASITNSATFAQPYPLLQLSLEDRFGSKVGSRAFKAGEYLGNNAQATRLLAAGESANIDLTIVDPGQDAVGFQFDTCLQLTNGLRCTHSSGG